MCVCERSWLASGFLLSISNRLYIGGSVSSCSRLFHLLLLHTLQLSSSRLTFDRGDIYIYVCIKQSIYIYIYIYTHRVMI